MLFHLFSVIIFFTSLHIGKINGGWRGALLCSVLGFFMAAFYDIFCYLGSRCVYDLKQRNPKSAEKLLRFFTVISLPLFTIILITIIFASIKLCETFLFQN